MSFTGMKCAAALQMPRSGYNKRYWVYLDKNKTRSDRKLSFGEILGIQTSFHVDNFVIKFSLRTE
jgi:hypothetical protein